jgi:hypothetical protein
MSMSEEKRRVWSGKVGGSKKVVVDTTHLQINISLWDRSQALPIGSTFAGRLYVSYAHAMAKYCLCIVSKHVYSNDGGVARVPRPQELKTGNRLWGQFDCHYKMIITSASRRYPLRKRYTHVSVWVVV